MKRLALVGACLQFGIAAFGAENPRTWTDKRGQKFDASVVAADAVRATLLLSDGRKTVAAIASLSPDDATYVREWRRSNRGAPLIDSAGMPPGPAAVVDAHY